MEKLGLCLIGAFSTGAFLALTSLPAQALLLYWETTREITKKFV
jgi:hypothetical protein